MADIVDSKKRSQMMAGINSKDTKPEMIVRKMLHREGYRYSLHKKSLPGTPDLYLAKYTAVIEIRGCYWHNHGCHLSSIPKSNTHFWRTKFQNNKDRDKRNLQELESMGLRVLIIWECAIRGKTSIEYSDLLEKMEKWLTQSERSKSIEGELFDSSL